MIQEALKRYQANLSPEDFQKLIASSESNAPISVRVNLLKNPGPEDTLKEWQERYGWGTKPVPFWQHAAQILNAETSPSQTIEHRFGYYYIQDAASMLPVALFSPIQEGEVILDMAASPGGKTTHLIDRALEKAFILANDSSASRLSALRVVTQSWGMANGAISNFAGEKLGDWFPECFDKILLDAPCSMESLRVSESHPFRDISLSERERLASRQYALLVSALKATKVGGELVYSTCTMAPEEDEALLDALIKRYPNAVEIAKIDPQDPGSFGLTQFEGQTFHPSLQNSLRVWPHLYETNGFFAAKLIKSSSIESTFLQTPQRLFASTGLDILNAKARQIILDQLQDRYGLSPNHLNHFEIGQRDTHLQIIPKTYLSRFETLPYHTMGMPLGKVIKNTLDPSFEFVSRFGMNFTYNVWEIPGDHLSNWLKGHDLRGLECPPNCSPGIIAIKNENDVLIGAGKWSAQRLRNLLPHRFLA